MHLLPTLLVLAIAPDRTPSDSSATSMQVVVAPTRIEGELPELDRIAVHDALRRGLTAPELTLFDPPEQCAEPPCPTAEADAHRVEMHLVAGARTYEVELRAYRPDQRDAYASASGRCDICGLAELEQLVLARADALRGRLIGDAGPIAAPTPVAASPVPAPRPQPVDDDRPTRASPRKVIGAVSLGLGIASIIGGAALVGIDGREIPSRCNDPSQRDPDGDCRWVRHTLAGGVVMALVGTGLAATGVALLVIDHKKRSSQLRATVGPTRVGLALSF